MPELTPSDMRWTYFQAALHRDWQEYERLEKLLIWNQVLIPTTHDARGREYD
jgi:hypothetical protein